jgi:hypothetical protein
MIAIILSFAISLILLAGLLGYKIIRVRNGETLTEEHHDIHSFIPEHVNLGEARKAVVKYGKQYGHETILSAIRMWFRTFYFVKKQKEIIVPKIKSMIPKKHREAQRPAVVSEFLQNVTEYKGKLKKISDRIKEEEKNI